MTTRMLTTLFLAAALGGLPLAAQQPGDPDYEPGEDVLEEYELLGKDTDSDYEFDESEFEQAADRTAADPPAVAPPSGAEVNEFRAGLEAHWAGTCPRCWPTCSRSTRPSGTIPSRPPRAGCLTGCRTTTTTSSATWSSRPSKSASAGAGGSSRSSARWRLNSGGRRASRRDPAR